MTQRAEMYFYPALQPEPDRETATAFDRIEEALRVSGSPVEADAERWYVMMSGSDRYGASGNPLARLGRSMMRLGETMERGTSGEYGPLSTARYMFRRMRWPDLRRNDLIIARLGRVWVA